MFVMDEKIITILKIALPLFLMFLSVFINYMLYGCISLKSIDLSSLDTSSVEDINNIFEGCTSLESIDLSKLDF